MTDARKDNNSVDTLLAVSNADGTTVKPVYGNASNHAIKVLDSNTGSDMGGAYAKRDNNRVTAIMAVSSSDGVSLVPLYVDSLTQALLIQST